MTLERWERVSEWPMIGAALVFLAAYSWQVIANVPEGAGDLPEDLIWVTWGVFIIDYVVKLWLAPSRGRWFLWHLHELVILTLPALRPLRLLRLVTVLNVFRTRAGAALRGRLLAYVVGSATMLLYCGALAVLDAEENTAGANIRSFPDALWWAFTTVTTVGYGDRYPVTDVGRAAAIVLMLAGIAVLGVVTASIASWLVEAVAKETAERTAEVVGEAVEAADLPLEQQMRALVAEVERLGAAIEARNRTSPGDAGGQSGG
ncbi:potassium channel family protein [Sinomonas gamaensis]|uniref:potassium channel family protein n=1 Tax=Sinomonas gamaensis TaxID=2565624 RepID=UPI001109A151|nr:potassium channel family protein [Sinomonas gamaensis]